MRLESDRSRRALLAGLLLAALGLYAWSLASHRPFVGYDAEGHLHYVATLLDEGRLPAPFEGWSTFHPPLYYLLVAGISWPTAPVWEPLWVEAVSAVAILATGGLAFAVASRLGHAGPVAFVATALFLFLPCVQLAATMLGNEALAAFFSALAATAGVRLQSDPRDRRTAAAVGLAVGLALATKFTGIFAAPALIVPFLRRDLDRDCLRAAGAGVLLLVLVAGAPYARNLAATGSPLPMTREREPVASVERSLTLRERRLSDYLWLDPAIFRLPVVHRLAAAGPARSALNPAAANVPGLAYASAWYDAHEIRVGEGERALGVRLGRWLLLLGLLPTGVMLLGLAASLRELFVRGPGAGAAPLTGMAVVGGLGFLAFTARAPAAPAVKASYLLPLAVPAVVFFARGVAVFGTRGRQIVLVGGALVSLFAAVSFANGVVFATWARPEREPASWMTPGVAEVATRLEGASAGRWLGIQAQPASRDAVAWRLLSRSYPPLRDAEVGSWCAFIAAEMTSRAPGQIWHATFVQGSERRHCPPPSRILRSP